MRIINTDAKTPEIVEIPKGFFVCLFCRYGQDAYFGLLAPESRRNDLPKKDSILIDDFQAFIGNQQILNTHTINASCRTTSRWFAATENFNLVGRGLMEERDIFLASNGSEHKATEIFVRF